MGYSHVRVNFHVTSAYGDEWTELYYRAATDVGTFLPAQTGPVPAALALLEKRLACLSNTFFINTVSIRSAPLPGGTESATRKACNFPPPSKQGLRNVLRDNANIAINVPIFSENHQRIFQLRGCPDVSTSFDAAGSPDMTVPTNATPFFDHLVTGGWQLYINKVSAGDENNKKISLVSVADGLVTFTIPGLVALGAVKKIMVSGAQGYKASQFNGVWQVGTVNLVNGTITSTTRRRIDPQFFYVLNSASVRLMDTNTKGFENISGWQGTVKPGKRSTGNPFEDRRGRRSLKR